jgi:telomere length regulation protein
MSNIRCFPNIDVSRHVLDVVFRSSEQCIDITLLLLVALSNLSSAYPKSQELSFSPAFIQSITYYISHLDPSVRRCGMLVAEEVARLAGKKLDFKDWDGDEEDKQWAKDVRKLLSTSDVAAEPWTDDTIDGKPPPELDVRELLTEDIIESPLPAPVLSNTGYDSDDSLTGYASQPSSRSASPTPEELAEIEKDPTLNVGKKKIQRPVYLAQLGELVRGSSGTQSGEDNQEVERMEMALNVAEELIRRKRDFGTELGKPNSLFVE